VRQFDGRPSGALSWSATNVRRPTQGLTFIVLAVLIVIAITGGLVVLAAAAFSRHRHFNEVDRFHRASRMTTEWARAGVTKPVFSHPDDTPRQSDRSEANERNGHLS